MPPTDLFRNPRDYEKLNEKVKKMLDKDCYCSIIVEAVNTGKNEEERIYRIIGEYQNNL
jgi:hypothetical protein